MKISMALAHICFPGSSDDKESARNAGDLGRTLEQEDCLEKGWRPTPVFLPGEFHGTYQATIHGVTKSWTPLSD